MSWNRDRMRIAVAAVCAVLLAAAPTEKKQLDASRWEKDIQAFEEKDKTSPPPKSAIEFIGSSSIRRWDVEKWFPEMKVFNRGFGGSHISDAVEFTSRIVIPYEPRAIVFYSGDNDLNSGKTPERVRDDFKEFARRIHARLPQTRIILISLKPSPAREKLLDQQRKANALLLEFVKTDKRLEYVDVFAPMLTAEGKQRPELFVKDMLHLNDDGYRLWTSLVMPRLKEAAAKAAP